MEESGRTSFLLYVITVFLVLLIGLGLWIGSPPKNSTPEELLETVFSAIRKDDWETYEKVSITYADIFQKMTHSQVSPFKQKMTYAGGVLKPEEMKRHRENFDRARRGAADQLDFSACRFVAEGTLIFEGTVWDEGDEPISASTYSIIVEMDGDEFDSKEFSPLFTLVPWNRRWRIYSLEFAEP